MSCALVVLICCYRWKSKYIGGLSLAVGNLSTIFSSMHSSSLALWVCIRLVSPPNANWDGNGANLA